MPSEFTTFEAGLRYELANRDFARIAMHRVARRMKGTASAPFWDGYARLEDHSAPIYSRAVERMGFTYTTPASARAKGAVIGATPKPLLTELLRITYPRTVEYLEELKRLRKAGPASESDFLRYMEEQEALQVRMMHDALRRDFAAVTVAVDEFTHAN